MWIKERPNKSGHYKVRDISTGKVGYDDYTTSGGGHWWNFGYNGGEDGVEYDPDSFKEL